MWSKAGLILRLLFPSLLLANGFSLLLIQVAVFFWIAFVWFCFWFLKKSLFPILLVCWACIPCFLTHWQVLNGWQKNSEDSYYKLCKTNHLRKALIWAHPWDTREMHSGETEFRNLREAFCVTRFLLTDFVGGFSPTLWWEEIKHFVYTSDILGSIS